VAGPEKLTALTYIKRGGGRARHGRKATNAHRDKSRQRSSRRWSSDDDGKSICGSSSCSIGGREFPLRQARLRLGHRGRTGASYASPCYQLMILLRLVADPYGFSTGGYAESLLRDWWNARIACGDIDSACIANGSTSRPSWQARSSASRKSMTACGSSPS